MGDYELSEIGRGHRELDPKARVWASLCWSHHPVPVLGEVCRARIGTELEAWRNSWGHTATADSGLRCRRCHLCPRSDGPRSWASCPQM